jgi:hypothetical protein
MVVQIEVAIDVRRTRGRHSGGIRLESIVANLGSVGTTQTRVNVNVLGVGIVTSYHVANYLVVVVVIQIEIVISG